MSKWIKCSDRLPSIKHGDNDISDDVLVCMINDKGRRVYFVGFYSHEDEEWYCQEGELQDWHEKTHWKSITPPVE